MNAHSPLDLLSPLTPWPAWWSHLQPHWANLLDIDPPWDFEHYSEEGWGKSAEGQYETQPLEWIQALPVGELADLNCLCLLWTRAPMLPQGIETLQKWGFRYVSWIHWQKVSRNGRQLRGTGHCVWSMGELVIVGKKGRPRHKAIEGNIPGERREHSRKPEEYYLEINRACPDLTRRVCLFSRQSRPGWIVAGDQATLFDGDSHEQTPRIRRATTGPRGAEAMLDMFGGDTGGRGPADALA